MEEEIARGGMGVVHKATDLASNHFVVIKSLLPQVAQIDEYKHRFIREAEEWVQLGTHPNIVHAYTAHEIDYLPHIVLEYVAGVSLHDMLGKGMLPLDQALDIAIQICWGMAYAHDKELTHRDLKPGNIMVSTGGTVKVTDFGLVKRMFEKGEKLLSKGEELPALQALMTQGILGTPEYMAPEQWQGEARQTLDIYAFGIILYEMFCGTRPFDFSNLEGMKRITAYQTAHCQEPPREPVLIREDLPPLIEQLILQCLEKDPELRPKTFRHVANRIDTLAKQIIGESFRKEPTPEELNRQGRLDQANGYLRLGAGCSFRGDYDKAVALYNKALDIFKAVNDKKGLSTYYNSLGTIYWRRSDHDRAMEMYQKSLEITEAMGDRKGMSSCYNNMGIIFRNQGKYDQAMEMYQKNLEVKEALDDHAGMSGCYNNIGIIFESRGKYDQALKMHQKSLEIREAIGDSAGMSTCYSNMGVTFTSIGKYDQALEMHKKSLEIRKAIGDSAGKGICYNNMGSLFYKLGSYDQAIVMQNKCLEIAEEFENKQGIGYGYLGLGKAYCKKKDFDQALEMVQKSLEIRKKIGHRSGVCESLYELGKLYSDQKQITQALEALNDSLEIMIELGVPEKEEVTKLIAEIKEKSNKE
ncbi:tetratricopeptide repeat protein [Planctomycetota bacterium]